MTPSPTRSDVQAALRAFLLNVLPAGTKVLAAMDNRVPEVVDGDFVIMTPIRFQRLETNIDDSADVKFTASIAGTLMTVTAVAFGAIEVGATVFGTGVAAGTVVTVPGTGTGGIGTYTVSTSQTVSSRTMSSGAKSVTQHAEVTVQLDVHGPKSGDSAQVISTLLRDEYGVQQFAGQSPNYGVVPLHADEPKQMPFVNAEQQYEWRWVVEAMLQVNQVVSVPQQYSDSIDVTLVSVDAVYPPS